MDPRLDELRSRRAAGENLAALRLAEKILEQPEGLTDAEAFEVARSGAAAGIFAQRYHVALRLAGQACWWANAAGNEEHQATADYYEGTILLHLDRTSEALERLHGYQRRSHLAPRYRGPALFNLGIACIQKRDYVEAGQYLAQARDRFRESGDSNGEIRALLEMAWVELLDNRMEPAGYHLEQARELLEHHPDEHLRAVRMVHMAYYHFLAGEFALAVRLCEEVMNPGRPGVTTHERSEAAWICGECALAQGHVDAARYMASLALDEAIQDRWPALMNRANDLRRRVNQAGEAMGE